MGDRRRERRLSVEIAGTLHAQGCAPKLIFISQMSANGCQFSAADLRLVEGEWIEIEIGPLDRLQAQVRWLANNTAGAELAVSLHPAILSYYGDFSRLAG